ncbi:hypothetical protein [Amycolatopsis sp. DG1A-15b]|uniref:hypothetical protein n=1 Tax=Amycolatopsis sp. DG1A-15b TaxID=3052846 RepID=UPI00255C0421|nr:hypothetical protein [Amycolatopsis sp. DG1A-15b]WIX85510.1 hypothetical protein QRY02_30300 [Amycolatopsis sp. DG1A-15b]
MRVNLAFIAVGVAAVLGFGVGRRSWNATTIGMLLALAAFVIGVLAGFVFGLPRTVQGERPKDDMGNSPSYLANTNLEQISDWLTKIIVGVGLVEAGSFATWFGRFSMNIGPTLADGTVGVVTAGAVLAYFAPLGFLSGYLWARTFLVVTLKEFDQLPPNSVAGPLLDLNGRLLETVQRLSRERAAADVRAGKGVLRSREQIVEYLDPVPTVVHTLGELWCAIEEILTLLIEPLSPEDRTTEDMAKILHRRGVLDDEMIDNLTSLHQASQSVASGATLSDDDATTVRQSGPALLQALARLRSYAPALFEKHVIGQLDRLINEGCRITYGTIPRQLFTGEEGGNAGSVEADATLEQDERALFVEVRAQVRNDGRPLEETLEWLARIPHQVPVLLVFLGDETTTPSVSEVILSDPTRLEAVLYSRLAGLDVLGWDAEYESFLDRVRAMLAHVDPADE